MQIFSFANKALKLLLVQRVRDHDAHVALHRKKNVLFACILQTIFTNVPRKMWCRRRKPSLKILRDKFKDFIKKHKEGNKADKMACKILEELSDVGQPLLDLLLR